MNLWGSLTCKGITAYKVVRGSHFLAQGNITVILDIFIVIAIYNIYLRKMLYYGMYINFRLRGVPYLYSPDPLIRCL